MGLIRFFQEPKARFLSLVLIVISLFLAFLIEEFKLSSIPIIRKFAFLLPILFTLGVAIAIINLVNHIQRHFVAALLGSMIIFYLNISTYGFLFASIPVLAYIFKLTVEIYFKCFVECFTEIFMVSSFLSIISGLLLGTWLGYLMEKKKKKVI